MSAGDRAGISIGGGVTDDDGEGNCVSDLDSLGVAEKSACALPGLFENVEESVDVHGSLCVGRNAGDLYCRPCEQDCDFSWKRLNGKAMRLFFSRFIYSQTTVIP